MAARTKSKVTAKYKTKYRVKNWPAYEASLKKRGDITFWFDEDAIAAWAAPATGRPGGQSRYSDLAIVTALTLRAVFHLPLRQTEGFVASLVRVMDLDLSTPDHTTLSRRGSTVEVPEFVRQHTGPIHLAIDSTGLKIVGDGEWHAHKHNTANKRRSWRKLHLGVDSEGFIVTSRLTDSGGDDAQVGVGMIEELETPFARSTADGAYDRKTIYEVVAGRGTPDVKIVIPPIKTASPSKSSGAALVQRDAAIERIAEVGRRQWRQESGAHQQARAENGMFRYKRSIGDGLRARRLEAQLREAMIGVLVINRMTELGMPQSVAVVAGGHPLQGTDPPPGRAMQQRP